MERRFLIVACPRCHTIQVVDGRNKSRQCATCGKRFDTSSLAVLGTGKDAREAKTVVSAIKAQKGAQEDQR